MTELEKYQVCKKYRELMTTLSIKKEDIVFNTSLTYIMSGKLINTYYQDLSEEYLTTIKPKKNYMVAIKSNTMLHAYYCFETRTIYYFDNQARLRMKTKTNNYDLAYAELKKEWISPTESLVKKINKAFKEGYYD